VTDGVNKSPAPLDSATIPRLKAHVRLQYSEARKQWIIQAPERVLMPDDIAVAVLKRCDGVATIGTIARALATEYEAPPDVVEADVRDMLQDLADKGVVTDART
jgi:pyrroloquinoline quinone biosynthesis protein D